MYSIKFLCCCFQLTLSLINIENHTITLDILFNRVLSKLGNFSRLFSQGLCFNDLYWETVKKWSLGRRNRRAFQMIQRRYYTRESCRQISNNYLLAKNKKNSICLFLIIFKHSLKITFFLLCIIAKFKMEFLIMPFLIL